MLSLSQFQLQKQPLFHAGESKLQDHFCERHNESRTLPQKSQTEGFRDLRSSSPCHTDGGALIAATLATTSSCNSPAQSARERDPQPYSCSSLSLSLPVPHICLQLFAFQGWRPSLSLCPQNKSSCFYIRLDCRSKVMGKKGRGGGRKKGGPDWTHPPSFTCNRVALSRLPAVGKLSSGCSQVQRRGEKGGGEVHRGRTRDNLQPLEEEVPWLSSAKFLSLSPSSHSVPPPPLLSWPRLWQRCKPWVTLLICWQMLSITLGTK